MRARLGGLLLLLTLTACDKTADPATTATTDATAEAVRKAVGDTDAATREAIAAAARPELPVTTAMEQPSPAKGSAR